MRGVGPIHASQNEVPQQGMSTASRKSAEHSGHFRSSGMSIADGLRPMCAPALLGLPTCAAVSARNCALRTRRQRSVCQNKQNHTEGHRTASWFGGARSDLTTGPCAERCAKSTLRAGRRELTREDGHAVLLGALVATYSLDAITARPPSGRISPRLGRGSHVGSPFVGQSFST